MAATELPFNQSSVLCVLPRNRKELTSSVVAGDTQAVVYQTSVLGSSMTLRPAAAAAAGWPTWLAPSGRNSSSISNVSARLDEDPDPSPEKRVGGELGRVAPGRFTQMSRPSYRGGLPCAFILWFSLSPW